MYEWKKGWTTKKLIDSSKFRSRKNETRCKNNTNVSSNVHRISSSKVRVNLNWLWPLHWLFVVEICWIKISIFIHLALAPLNSNLKLNYSVVYLQHYVPESLARNNLDIYWTEVARIPWVDSIFIATIRPILPQSLKIFTSISCRNPFQWHWHRSIQFVRSELCFPVHKIHIWHQL